MAPERGRDVSDEYSCSFFPQMIFFHLFKIVEINSLCKYANVIIFMFSGGEYYIFGGEMFIFVLSRTCGINYIISVCLHKQYNETPGCRQKLNMSYCLIIGK